MLPPSVVFTIACIILTVNAVLFFWPYMSKGFRPPTAVLYIEGVLGVLSSTLFLIGGVFFFIDVYKAGRGERLKNNTFQDYGTVIIEDDLQEMEKTAEKSRRQSIRIAVTEVLERTSSLARMVSQSNDTAQPSTVEIAPWWRLFPPANEIRVPELRFLASLISLCSSVVYTITAVLSMIQIVNEGHIAAWIRYPQLVAGVGFAIASAIQMLQAQTTWWKPAIHSLAWHTNVLNLVGSAGFVFCAWFGLLKDVSWAEYQFGCSYLWGSWAFLFASAMSSYKAFRRRRDIVVETSKV